jgi:PKD repeat protein
VKADFSAVPTSGAVPLTVEFTNISTGDYDTCTWDFGDGESDIRCSDIHHTYEQTGAHSVKLTVTEIGGIGVERKVDYVTVTEGYEVFLPLVIRQRP